MSDRLTDEEEKVIAMSGTCPICGAENGEACRRGDGKPVAAGKLHAGRLRKRLADEELN